MYESLKVSPSGATFSAEKRRAKAMQRAMPLYWVLAALLALLIILLFAAVANAYEPGDQVVLITDENGIRIGNTIVDEPPMGTAFTVRAVNGEWLNVSRGTPGWVISRDVIALDRAINYFTSRIDRNPGDDRLYAARAWVHYELGEFEEAIADYAEAIRIYPHDSWYNNRGLVYYDLGEYREAIRDYQRAIEIGGIDEVVLQNRGDAYAQLGEYEQALADYNSSIRLDPTNAFVFASRAFVYFYLDDYENAIGDFSEAVALDPGYAYAHSMLGWLLATCPVAEYRDGPRAVEEATLACELDGWQIGDDLDTLAAAYAEIGDFESAVKYVNQAIDLVGDADYVDYYYDRLALYEEGRPYRLPMPETAPDDTAPSYSAPDSNVNPIR